MQSQLENFSLKLRNTLPRFLTHKGAVLQCRGIPEINHRAEASPELFSASCQASAGPSWGLAPQVHCNPHPAGFLPPRSRLGSVSPLLGDLFSCQILISTTHYYHPLISKHLRSWM